MAKGERRRRRREEESGETAAESSAGNPESDAVQPGESATGMDTPYPADAPLFAGTNPPADETDGSSAPSHAPDMPRRRMRAQQASIRSMAEPSNGAAAQPATPKPVALAEVLANPSLAMRPIGALGAERQESTPAPDAPSSAPPAKTFAQPPEVESVMKAREHEQERDGEIPPLPPSSAAAPPPARTREPMIIALLLVAIVILAFNTYSTLRLNGLADRLTGGSNNGAASAVSASDRPWVGVDNIKTQPFASGGQPVTNVHIANSGREPAYDLRSNTVGSLRSATTAAPDIPAQKGPLATTGLLLPNTGGNLTFFANTRALTAEEAANVKSGKYVLWLAGRLDYKDAQGRVHLTSFRYRYNPALNGFVAAPQGNMAN